MEGDLLTSTSLTQAEAQALLYMQKHYKGSEVFLFPSVGGNINIPLQSENGREEFHLDINRGKIKLTKNTLQNRARKTIVLLRIDIDGGPHRNPDGVEIPCPHMHMYREGSGDKWAIPLPSTFARSNDFVSLLDQFMGYCNVATKPQFHLDAFT